MGWPGYEATSACDDRYHTNRGPCETSTILPEAWPATRTMGNKLSYPTVDLSGKVAVVTGGNTGIGYEIAKALAEMGAHTFIACKLQEGASPAIAVSL